MGMKLEGRVAVVTGGSAGIGLGAAKRFAEEGARVFITGRDKAKLAEALAVIGHGAIAIRADAANLADIDRIYATVKAEAGRIDVLFVNAGFYEIGTFGEITAEHFDKTFNTNVRGLLFAVQKALPLLSRGAGSSISRAAHPHQRAEPGPYRYAGSFAALRRQAAGGRGEHRAAGTPR